MHARCTVMCSLIFTLMLAFAVESLAQDNKAPYTRMAPVEQYMMDRSSEISLARSPAPESISHDATILILGRHGYEVRSQ